MTALVDHGSEFLEHVISIQKLAVFSLPRSLCKLRSDFPKRLIAFALLALQQAKCLSHDLACSLIKP